MIPYGRQDITDEDVAAVVEVLRSPMITQGPAIEQFEHAVAERCGARHAVAVSSGTAALHLACLAAGLGPGNRMWTVPNSFVASANCGAYCGADVDFIDIHPRSWLLDLGELERRLEEAERDGRLPQLVVPVDFAGHPGDLQAIGRLARRFGFRILEDASHAMGARHAEGPVGDGRDALATVFSFHPVKIITTGEGGMVVTNEEALATRLRELRIHGVTRDPGRMDAPNDQPWYYEQHGLGFNYRITDIQCALGTSQLERLERYVERRNELAARYDRLLEGLPVVAQERPHAGRSAFHLYVVRIDGSRTRRTRREVYDAMRAAAIGVNVHYYPIHLQPFWRSRGFGPGDFPEAERYAAEALTLPLFPTLSEDEQDQVVAALRAALKE